MEGKQRPGLIILLPRQGWIGWGAPKAQFLEPSKELPTRNPHKVLMISTPKGELLQYVLCVRKQSWLIYREVALAS